MLAEIPPSLQIIQNLPLDSYLSYLHVLTEIPPPPQFADFLQSATGQLPKLPTCVCRNSPTPQFADFLNSATGQLPKLPTCACRIPTPFYRFSENLPLDSYLHVTCTKCPHLQNFSNLPLDICRFVLAEIPPQFADFLKICHWTVT